jgi:REP element-mobilizing transposase RayT
MSENLPSASTETDRPETTIPDEERGRRQASDPRPSLEHSRAGLKEGSRDLSEAPGEDSAFHFEPVAKYPYDLSYACLMIPRFAAHSLSGDLVVDLYNWLQYACISFGWRLESANVQPGYLQWMLSVPPAVPPAHIIRVIRQYTSKRIFEEYPRFKKENISGDFWAPGHLVIVGRRPHTPEMISEFIRLTRQQQGMQFIPRR